MLRSRAVQLLSLLVLIVATAPASDVSAHSLTCNGVTVPHWAHGDKFPRPR